MRYKIYAHEGANVSKISSKFKRQYSSYTDAKYAIDSLPENKDYYKYVDLLIVRYYDEGYTSETSSVICGLRPAMSKTWIDILRPEDKEF